MAKNYREKGEVMTITAGADLSSGQPVIVGDMAVVALVDIANGETGAAAAEGVFELPAATAAIDQGVKVYWDADGDPVGGEAGSGACTATATDNDLLGIAWEAKAAGGATVLVKLNAA
ncbi:MAG: DUF2190 family protein [Deltaproteobacteria bacterium]|nr:DUF2190 family protein [Deltaproteobacteria bacterium]